MSIILDISGDEHITIDTFQPGDAPGVGDLFRKVYGEDYRKACLRSRGAR
jgi:hypothetical protein